MTLVFAVISDRYGTAPVIGNGAFIVTRIRIPPLISGKQKTVLKRSTATSRTIVSIPSLVVAQVLLTTTARPRLIREFPKIGHPNTAP